MAQQGFQRFDYCLKYSTTRDVRLIWDLNPFQDDNNLTLSKLKALADDKSNVAQNLKKKMPFIG